MENPPSSKIIKKMENEPNFKESKVLQVTAIERFTTLSFQKETNPNEPNKANFLEKTLLKDSTCQKYTHWILVACFGPAQVVYSPSIQILMRILGLKQA